MTQQITEMSAIGDDMKERLMLAHDMCADFVKIMARAGFVVMITAVALEKPDGGSMLAVMGNPAIDPDVVIKDLKEILSSPGMLIRPR